MIMIDSFSGRWRFLSNFYPAKILHQGITYPTVEHYYVAMKIKNDQQIDGRNITHIDCREMIAKMPAEHAGKVKQLGQILKVRKDWKDVKMDVMLWGVREKFKHEDLKQMLLDTGEQELIEGNWWHDNFFGICTCGPCQGQGQNNLGKILMKVREELRQQNVKPSLEELLKSQKK
jgi:ribA/ribD-fused uncharacterized protein